jgi:class 3 adenylate cyclase
MFEAISAFIAELGGHHPAPTRKLATVLFTDIVRSTERSVELGDAEWKALLERHHTAVRAQLARNGGREISTAGDGFFATFEGPPAAARCALDAIADVRELGLHIRAGVHTGEVETIDGEIGGLGVTIGAWVGALAGADEVLASSTVRDLAAGSGPRVRRRRRARTAGRPRSLAPVPRARVTRPIRWLVRPERLDTGR